MKKWMRTVLLLVCAVCLAGCDKQLSKEKSGTLKMEITSEDYAPGTGGMMVTDNGFYYYSCGTDLGYHYCDRTTGGQMYLCNKPECRHDGNEFCVATNARYYYLDECIYSEKLFLYALEVTETQYLFKLLAAELDGSAMNEVATITTLEKTEGNISIDNCGMIIHRNTAMLEVHMEDSDMEDVRYYGVAVLNLNTGEVSWLDEDPLGGDNVEVSRFRGYGDWIYYCRKEGKKKLLHRYHITEKTDEVCKLLTGFSGYYEVKDADTVLYLRSGMSELCSYRYSTGENVEETRIMTVNRYYYTLDGISGVTEDYVEATDILDFQTDGEYFYFPELVRWLGSTDEEGNQSSRLDKAYVHVFNRELEEIAVVDLALEFPIPGFEETEWTKRPFTIDLHYCGEEIFWTLSPQENMAEEYIFCCKRSDFLAGTPEFTFVCRRGQ